MFETNFTFNSESELVSGYVPEATEAAENRNAKKQP